MKFMYPGEEMFLTFVQKKFKHFLSFFVIMVMNQKIKEEIVADSLEFDQLDGSISCEFAIHQSQLDEFEEFVKNSVNLKLGRWIVMGCDTCVRQHGEGFHHASIEKHAYLDGMVSSSNFIKLI